MSEHDHSTDHHEFRAELERSNRILAAISRCCDVSPAKHDSRLDRATAVNSILTKLKASGIDFQLSDRGWVIAEKHGTTVGLQELVENILLTDPDLRDAASVQAAVSSGGLEVKAKSDLATRAEKAAWISRHSLREWEALPLNRETALDLNPATMTAADVARLSVRQKTELHAILLTAHNGNLREAEKAYGEILRRK
jgi:hypothetical protein